ncbi:uncharacterized protein F4822DRAFT_81632 [Hypoxylon trugodes]|uniref:uncharacterized protein n=1 Tax=Hypoxylon trugodes TaxID=326681 RepID=UPI0021983848|nr:uncharacterized protein F4822DRAFT_81632 [Hypoxylon trugodes]KAI1383567.1 hypothetical protein F4822DRAFT_81632 [Hypoxylon trugodes]
MLKTEHTQLPRTCRGRRHEKKKKANITDFLVGTLQYPCPLFVFSISPHHHHIEYASILSWIFIVIVLFTVSFFFISHSLVNIPFICRSYQITCPRCQLVSTHSIFNFLSFSQS